VSQDVLHPGHRSIRIKGYDYSTPRLYFVTICTHNRQYTLGRIADGRMQLGGLGRIVDLAWREIPSHFATVKLHAFVVMPNHVHGLIEVGCQAGAQHAAPLQDYPTGKKHQGVVTPGSLSAIVRSFKSVVTKRAREEMCWRDEVWQRNYFERVVRDSKEFAEASRYILENPLQWEWDQENVKVRHVGATETNRAQHGASPQEAYDIRCHGTD
jgi:putative transposase